MANFPGPYQLRIFYTCVVGGITRNHVATYNIDLASDPGPGLNFEDYDVLRRVSAPQDLQAYTDAWVTLIRPLWGTGCTLVAGELWKFVTGTNNASFYSAYEIALAGSSGSGIQPDAELIMTWRTTGGGTLRFHWLETIFPPAVTDPAPFANAALDDIRVFVNGDDNAFLGRDNTMPFYALAVHPGQNEKLFKDRFRP